MASLVKTYKGDLTTFIASKIWDFVKERAKRTGEPPEDVEDDQLRGQSSPVNPVTSIVPVPVDLIKKSQSFDKGELGSLARKDPLLKKRMIQERMRPMGGKPIISA